MVVFPYCTCRFFVRRVVTETIASNELIKIYDCHTVKEGCHVGIM
jgi:hypothetical protein